MLRQTNSVNNHISNISGMCSAVSSKEWAKSWEMLKGIMLR